ncbi:MAG: phosphotransferase [Brachybacterium sp.]|uniref:phosphotransferase n=1 Tax=Brachybacterium sp. TaxID=1891286 RepID=UPI002647C83F|nr:phosphotransferase [Brachybacterium sp.]MDN5687805.1 phosphotransferase [Brachybacterium sp.]
MTPVDATPVFDPAAQLAAYADLPGARTLLDADALGDVHGHALALSRVRVKPGASALVSHHRTASAESGPAAAPGRVLADVGWTLLVASRHKRDGALRRAARSGAPLLQHDSPGDGPYLLSGGLEADPRIGRRVHRVLRWLGATGAVGPAGSTAASSLRVLSFNPARHAVLHLPGTQQVLRLAARPLDDVLDVTRSWLALGVPTLQQRAWHGKSSVLIGEHWGDGDLAHHSRDDRAMPAAAATGAALARLHGAALAGDDLPAARLGAAVPDVLDPIATLLPSSAGVAQHLARQLRDRLPERPRQGLIHGDLSPDQVLMSLGPAAGPSSPEIRIVDLDRSGRGPLGADLGSWLASCLVAGTEDLARAFLDGYAREGHLPTDEELAVWTARALLAAATDPIRRFHPDWPTAVVRRLELAEQILAAPETLPFPVATGRVVPSASSGQRAAHGTGAATASSCAPLVPARVLADGTVWEVARAWPDDGRGLPLELRADDGPSGGRGLRGARLDPTTGSATVFAPGTDPRLPGLARRLAADPDASVVSHRPGKRAVVRIGAPGDPAGERYVKIVRPGRAGRIHDALTRASSFDGPFRLQREVAADEESSTTAALTGTTLHEELSLADGTWRRAWRDTLLAWAEALAAAPAEPRDGTIHGPAEEIAVLETWRRRAADVDPAGAAMRESAAGAARRELSRLETPAQPSLIHRDLHDKQILHAPGLAPGLLDVDTTALGDPALDLANLRAHTGWRELQEIWSPEHARVVREEIDAAALRGRIPAATLAAYEAGTLARLACVYAFRPRWRVLARSLAAELVPGTDPSPPDPAGPPSTPGRPSTALGDRPTVPSDPSTTVETRSTTPDERTVTS